MIHCKFNWSLVVLFVLTAQTANAFSGSMDNERDIREQITREALTGIISDTNLDFMVKTTSGKDSTGVQEGNEPRRFYGDGNFSSALSYLDREKKRALNYAGDSDVDPSSRSQALKHFALALQVCQEFYSLSNYVEIQLEDMKKSQDPYSIELVDWTRVPSGYQGKTSGQLLMCTGKTSFSESSQLKAGLQTKIDHSLSFQFNKDTPESVEGRRQIGKTTYFKVARELALRETQRQWNSFEALIRNRFPARSQGIIAALKQASPNPQASPESLIDSEE